jgi:hypothetical protein
VGNYSNESVDHKSANSLGAVTSDIRASKPEQSTPATGNPKRKPTGSSGAAVLVAFSVVIVLYGLMVIALNWHHISQNHNSVLFDVGLFLAMVAGMFVQVIAANHREGKPLFDATASDLIYPLLFSVIVFYPIWALTTPTSHNFFSIHAAFLNGYFWESVVASARSPAISAEQPNSD